jgi:hypothetical protein
VVEDDGNETLASTFIDIFFSMVFSNTTSMKNPITISGGPTV